ncbi:MAG: hypothetical protein IKN04_08785 [Clostridia bacterium]|nr:hypothetical protein [Clostridia bacterium]
MAQIGNWNGHTFEVSDKLIRGFSEMSIKGGCETTEKNANQQKYVERKYGEIPSITFVVGLNAMVGVTDVMGESMAFIEEATAGAADYFYLGGKKLLPGKMRLTEAEVVEIAHMPGKGDIWISSKVRLTLKQGTESDGGGSAGSGSGGSSDTGSQKQSVKSPTPTQIAETADAIKNAVGNAVTTGINAVKTLIENAKAASTQSKNNQVDAITSAAPSTSRVTQINKDSSKKVTATTGRSIAMAKKLVQKAKNK